MPLQYFLYRRIVFWLLSGRGENKNIGARVEKTDGYVFRTGQTNFLLLSDLTYS